MSHRLSKAEIALRIEAGAKVRQARLEKRQQKQAEQEKRNLLNQNLLAVDAKHKVLKKELQAVLHHLNGVVYREEYLEIEQIPTISAFFEFDNDLDERIALKMCRDDYVSLIAYCISFENGPADELCQKAYEFWDKILSYPEVQPTGSLIINLLASGNISAKTFEILRRYQTKFESAALSMPIAHMCRQLLKDGGVSDLTSGEIHLWTPAQETALRNIEALFA